jgi:hypothetical protein
LKEKKMLEDDENDFNIERFIDQLEEVDDDDENFDIIEECDLCEGNGFTDEDECCPVCLGSGKINLGNTY